MPKFKDASLRLSLANNKTKTNSNNHTTLLLGSFREQVIQDKVIFPVEEGLVLVQATVKK